MSTPLARPASLVRCVAVILVIALAWFAPQVPPSSGSSSATPVAHRISIHQSMWTSESLSRWLRASLAMPVVWPATLTQQDVQSLVARWNDWNVLLMTQVAMCESSWEPAAYNPVAVWIGGVAMHSAGLLGVLDGSIDPVTNVAQAHAKWLSQGYGAWQIDFTDGCA